MQYRVVATTLSAAPRSAGVTISVSDLDVAPTITTQPGNLSVTAGGDAVFAVVARGTEALSYQWSRNGTPIMGANSPVLRLTGVTSAAHGGVYRVTVSNGAGTVDSDAVTLTVTAGAPAAVAPSIVTQPAAVTVNAGNTATFAVGVDGSGPFTFAWRKDGVAISGRHERCAHAELGIRVERGQLFGGGQQRRCCQRDQLRSRTHGSQQRGGGPSHHHHPAVDDRHCARRFGTPRGGGRGQRPAVLSVAGCRCADDWRNRARSDVHQRRCERAKATTP